jgi:tRNA (adenine37-N6)-methyltransferase
MDIPAPSALSVTPIGFIHTSRKAKFDAPHQPDPSSTEESIIELLPNRNYEKAVHDLDGFSHIWLIWWFHRNTTWRPKVMPPRGKEKRRGVFATRSPHRPNPIGITVVPLFRIVGRKVYIGSNDLVDQTPILDIKPYLPRVDSLPDSTVGWIGEVERELAAPPTFRVDFSPLAAEQLSWLRTLGIDFMTRAKELLERDPTPHRTRRIIQCADETFRMGCGAWRLFFVVQGNEVNVLSVTSGYPLRSLKQSGPATIPHREELLLFLEKWPLSGPSVS